MITVVKESLPCLIRLPKSVSRPKTPAAKLTLQRSCQPSAGRARAKRYGAGAQAAGAWRALSTILAICPRVAPAPGR
jgi:hypothetical protein